MIWLGRLVVLLLALGGLVLAFEAFPLQTTKSWVLLFTGLGFAFFGGEVAIRDGRQILRELKQKH